MLKGIDISTFQPSSVMSQDWVQFVMIKASEGKGYKDDMLDKHYNYMTARTKIKKYGFYHYARPDLGNTAEIEAQSFLSYVGHHTGKCLYALDWEGQALNYPLSWAEDWLDYVYENTKQIPLLYGSASTMDKYNGRYPIWVAHWGVSAPEITRPWAMWQYSDGDGSLDHDYFHDEIYQWDHLCDGRFWGSSKPAPATWHITKQSDSQIILEKY